jgi:hypothetical protein
MADACGPEKYAPPHLRPASAIAEISGPEKYAPTHWRAAKGVTAVEPGVQLHRQSGRLDPNNDADPGNPNRILQRIATAVMSEIDTLVRALNNIRAAILNEGERVNNEIINYANRKQMAEAEIEEIAGSLEQWIKKTSKIINSDKTLANPPNAISTRPRGKRRI